MYQEPLEEVIASVDFPVYGLTEEVFGLRLSGYRAPRYDGYWDCSKSHQFLTLDYQSERYVPFLHEKFSKKPTFSVHSSRGLSGPPLIGIKSTSYVHWEEGPNLPVQDSGQTLVFCSSLTIDGEQFIGNFLFYPAPIFHSIYVLSNGHRSLHGQACGPHPEELIQILQSLRVLNGKAVQ